MFLVGRKCGAYHFICVFLGVVTFGGEGFGVYISLVDGVFSMLGSGCYLPSCLVCGKSVRMSNLHVMLEKGRIQKFWVSFKGSNNAPAGNGTLPRADR